MANPNPNKKTHLAYFNNEGGENNFRCHLLCGQCVFVKDNGEQCRNRVCVGYPYCRVHTRKKYGVEVRERAEGGKGLFATRNFAVDAWIVPFVGEPVQDECTTRRYRGDPPYTITDGDDTDLDASCIRGTASMASANFDANRVSLGQEFHNTTFQSRGDNDATWLRAMQNINAGEEILLYPGEDGFRERVGHRTRRTTRDDNRPCP